MFRALFVMLLVVTGVYYSLQGPFYALLFYIWNAYFRPEDWLWWDFVRDLRLSYLIGLYLVLTSLFSRQRFVFNGKISLLLLFLCHTFLSTWFSEHFDYSWVYWQDFLKSTIITYLIIVLVHDLAQYRLLLLIMVLSLGVEGAKQGWFYLLTSPGGANTNPIAFLGDNNGVALGMLMLVPICALLAQTAQHKWERLFYWFLLLGILYRALSTYSRGGFLACLALGGAYWVRSRQKLRMLLGTGIIIGVILPVLPEAFWARMQTIETYEEVQDDSALGRLHFWAVAREMAKANPVLGVGYMGYNPSYDTYDFSNGQYGRKRSVHSSYFGVLAELGYPGITFFGLVFFCAFRSCHRVRRLANTHSELLAGREYATALEASLVAFLVGSIFLPAQYSEMVWHYIGLTLALEKIMTHGLPIHRADSQQSHRILYRGRREGPVETGCAIGVQKPHVSQELNVCGGEQMQACIVLLAATVFTLWPIGPPRDVQAQVNPSALQTPYDTIPDFVQNPPLQSTPSGVWASTATWTPALSQDPSAPNGPTHVAAMPVHASPAVLNPRLSARGPSENHSPAAPSGVEYDIVYVRAPRYGDNVNTRWPEVKDPIHMEPGADLVLLHPDGSEEVLVPGGDGAIVDPYVSFDGRWIYFAKFHNLQKDKLNVQRRHAAVLGADIYKIHVETRAIHRLTLQEWTPNTGAANWSKDHLSPSSPGTHYLGYGIFNLGPCPLPGGRVMFTSSRNSFLPNRDFTFPNLQLFVMDNDGKNIEQIGHMNLGSALHPTMLVDGRVMFASYEAQGLRDIRLWGLWALWPDGRHWEPLLSAFEDGAAFHFQAQLSNSTIVAEEYYNQNNNGFGSLVMFPPTRPVGVPPFGEPNPRHASNPPFRQGTLWDGKPRYEAYPFSPYGLLALTAFTHGKDEASPKEATGVWAGKVTHPSGAPNNDLLLVWTPGPANNLARPTERPYYDSGIYLLRGGKTAESFQDLVRIKNDPRYNEMQPRAVVPYMAIYGVEEPVALPSLPNDGSASPHLPAGTPFGLVGTSTFYKRNTTPGGGKAQFNGLDPFNTRENEASSNWGTQGADAGRYTNDEIYAVRIVSLEPTTHRSYGPYEGNNFFNHANERMRILGEIPLRKYDAAGNPIRDVDGNPDTSFLAKIPADVPFTFQTLDKHGLVLNMSQTWHQVRPGEVRYDCGGCHAHAQVGTDFALTAAAQPDYAIADLTQTTPLLQKNASGNTIVETRPMGAVDVEYYRDIKPILQRSCVKCHSKHGPAEAGLVLDDTDIVNGYENTYHRLANDPEAKYGRPPLIGTWRQANASRYVRKFQSRRSLLIWKIFGRRLDGWTNDDHPTETVPGDKSTFPVGANPDDADLDFVGATMPPPDSRVPPLTEDEKMRFARWVDLGCPINLNEAGRKNYGWFLDDLRPTLTLSLPRAGVNRQPLTLIRIGAFDYYSGLNRQSLSVKANFPVNGERAGAELASLFTETGDHTWIMPINPGLTSLPSGEITISIKDKQGNLTRLVRSFSIVTAIGSEWRRP